MQEVKLQLDESAPKVEFSDLPRWAGVALAARNAMRAAPLFIPDKSQSPDDARRNLEAVEICQLSAALAAIRGTPNDLSIIQATYRAAETAVKAFGPHPGFAAARLAGFAALASGDGWEGWIPKGLLRVALESYRKGIPSVTTVLTLAFKDYERAFADGQPSPPPELLELARDAARWDYLKLREQNLGMAGENGMAVPQVFFAFPLWPRIDVDSNRLLAPYLSKWKAFSISSPQLGPLYERYERMLRGGGIDWDDAQSRVSAWVLINVKDDKATASSTVVEQAAQGKPAPPASQPANAKAAPASNAFTPLRRKIATIAQPQKLVPSPVPRPSDPKEARRPSLRMLADAPLTDDEGDRLDFKSYANALAGLIDNPNTSTPLTLAINAPWGAGKTTLARMIQRRLETKPAAGGYYPHATCWFNAWMHDDAPSLAAALTAEVAYAAEKFRPLWWRVLNPLPSAVLTSNKCRARRLIFVIDLLLLAFCLAELFVVLGFFPRWAAYFNLKLSLNMSHSVGSSVVVAAVLLLGKLGSVLVPLGKGLADYVHSPQEAAGAGSVENARQQLGRLIKQARGKGSRFVIFVDDLERCRPPRPVDVLEVVNQLLNHEGVVTVIMSDMMAVAACAEIKYKELAKRKAPAGTKISHGSAHTYGGYGRAYLQKIVQLQFDLPQFNAGSAPQDD